MNVNSSRAGDMAGVVYVCHAVISILCGITNIRMTSYLRLSQPFLESRKGWAAELLSAGESYRYKTVRKWRSGGGGGQVLPIK